MTGAPEVTAAPAPAPAPSLSTLTVDMGAALLSLAVGADADDFDEEGLACECAAAYGSALSFCTQHARTAASCLPCPAAAAACGCSSPGSALPPALPTPAAPARAPRCCPAGLCTVGAADSCAIPKKLVEQAVGSGLVPAARIPVDAYTCMPHLVRALS